MTILHDSSLLSFNTFGIDVKADYLIEYDSVEDLRQALKLDVICSNKLLPVGSGSNLLFLNDFKRRCTSFANKNCE